jgi:zinc/manganese transport system ATP-binding protein
MITLNDLTLGYDRHPAVHHLNGCFKAGSMTAVVGPNGAGKSTLLKGIVGLLKPLSGSVELAGFDKRDIAYSPQLAEMDLSFPVSVLDAVCLGHWRRSGTFGSISSKLRQDALYALGGVGLEGFENRSLETLSVGQRQRALFARVIVADATVIILDEPFAAVDAGTTVDLLELMRVWRMQGRTVIAVVHDLDLVRRHFPDCLLMAREIIAWGPTEQVLVEENLEALKTIIEAWDDTAPVCERGAA